MNIHTHELIDPRLCGRPLSVAPGCSRMELKTVEAMQVDSFVLDRHVLAQAQAKAQG